MNLRQKYKKLKKEHERLKRQYKLADDLWWSDPSVPITRGYEVETQKIMSRMAISADSSNAEQKWAERELAYDMAIHMMENGYIKYSKNLENNSIGTRLVIAGYAYIGKEK